MAEGTSRKFVEDVEPGDNNPENIHPEHTLWPNSKLVDWLRWSATQLVRTEIQCSICREAARRLESFATNPRHVEQDLLRLFVKLAREIEAMSAEKRVDLVRLDAIRTIASSTRYEAEKMLSMFGTPGSDEKQGG